VLQARTPRASGLAQLTSRGRIAANEGDFHALRRESNSYGAAYISGSKDGDLHSALGHGSAFCGAGDTINEEKDKNNNEPLTIFSLSLDSAIL
jgi:hypothetical protein